MDCPSQDKEDISGSCSLDRCARGCVLNRCTDDDLVLRAQSEPLGSVERKFCLSLLYERYKNDVWRFIRSRVNSDQCADDRFGDTWKIALEKFDDYEVRGATFKSYLFAVAHRVLLQYFRESQNELSRVVDIEIAPEQLKFEALSYIDQYFEGSHSTENYQTTEDVKEKARALVNKAMKSLTTDQNKVIYLCFFEGKNSTEIGEIIGKSPGAVRQIKRRALKQMRQMLRTEEMGSNKSITHFHVLTYAKSKFPRGSMIGLSWKEES